MMVFSPPGDLPIISVLPALRNALREHCRLILEAPPGAGKTSIVPLALLDEPWLAGRKIVMLEPRRLAARAAARRMAELLDEGVGETVGYRVRLDHKVSCKTRIEVVTEGILTRMLQRDPALTDVGLVIFDEFHERNLHADLGLALARDVQKGLRPELRLLIMSATIDSAALAERFDHPEILRAEGRCFSVQTLHRPLPDGEWLPRHVARTVCQAWDAHTGSILVFLPGAGEIHQVMRELNACLDEPDTLIQPLYGNLPRHLQDEAIEPAPAARRKIVLATPIAQTSLTIEGIEVVVDSGLQRVARFDPNSGMTRLDTIRISRAAADQRRGRAGRLGPGICYRLWSIFEDSRLMPHALAEIAEADLTVLALELANWGTPDPARLEWIDPPPSAAMAVAKQLLQTLGALQMDGWITAHGRDLLGFAMHPRLAQMLVRGRAWGHGALACRLAALLEDRDILKATAGRTDVDISTRLDVLDAVDKGGHPRIPGYQVEYSACRMCLKLARQWMRRLGVRDDVGGRDAVGALLLEAYPDRLAKKRARTERSFLLVNGKGAVLPIGDPLARTEFLVAADLDAGRTDAEVFLAAGLDRQTVEQRFAGDLEEVSVVEWDPRSEALVARQQTRLRSVILRDRPLQQPPADAMLAAILTAVRDLGMSCLPWNAELRNWQARVLLLRRSLGGEWPDVSDPHLTDHLELWLAPFLSGVSRRGDFERVDLRSALHGRLDYRQQRELQDLAPTHLQVPSGARVPLDYQSGPVPILAARVQQMFGATETPKIANGHVPVLIHLLSPAGRPVQVTDDLRNFWAETYAEVRKQLRGRYPKHPWPDDPSRAIATDRAKRRER